MSVLTVPFALIGVGCGLLIMGAPFGFFALLGILSLIGMVIKNGIILVEQIKLEYLWFGVFYVADADCPAGLVCHLL